MSNVDPSGLLQFNINLGQYLPAIPEPAYNFSMGLANGVSFGLAQPISNLAFGYQTANIKSSWYVSGELTSMLTGRAAVGRSATQTAMRNADNVINSSRVAIPKPDVTIPTSVIDRIPSNWGLGSATKKGDGWRWQDPGNVGNGVRIDMGNPNNSQVIQQVDHVLIRENGRVIGSNGLPIKGSIKNNPAEAHIPISIYERWRKWNSP